MSTACGPYNPDYEKDYGDLYDTQSIPPAQPSNGNNCVDKDLSYPEVIDGLFSVGDEYFC